MTERQPLQFGKLGQLIVDVSNLVAAQIETLQGWQATFPAGELLDQVGLQIELLELGQSLEVRQVFELVVDGDKDAKSGMALPALVDLLELVARDVQVVQLGALEAWPFVEFVVRDVEPLEVEEGLLGSEHGEVLDAIVRKIETRQS